MDIDVAAVIDTLRAMAKEEGAPLALPKVDLFNRLFLKSVSRHGRMFETGMMAGYSLRTMSLFSSLGMATKMLVRGRLAFAPSKSKDRARVKSVMKAAASKKEGK
jgi:heterodisulfide reductase subunit C